MSEVLANLRNEITCPICKKIFTKPKLTPCLHKFCCECLNELARLNTYGSVIHCPVCLFEIKKPEGDNLFESLSDDFHAGRLLELYIVKESNNYSKYICDSCNRTELLESVCFDCSTFLCNKCSSEHNKRGDISNHHVRTLKEFTKEDFKELYQRMPLCEEHKSEQAIVEYYCHQCNRCMCYFCDLEDDKDHSPVGVLEAGEEKKAELIESMKLVKDKMDVTLSGIAALDQRQREIDKKINLVKSQVHSKVEEIIASLKTHEREMIEQLENIRGTKHDTLQSQRSELEMVLKQVQSCCEFVDNMVERDIASEMIIMSEHVSSRLSYLAQINVEEVKPQESCCVGYLPNMVMIRKMKESSVLGNISTSNTDPPSSHVEGAGLLEASVGEEAIFTVKTRDLQKQLSYSIIDKLEVIVTSEDKTPVSCQIINSETGTYDVSYIPKAPGEYKIYIKVTDEPIKGSPFCVIVKPPVLMPLKSFASHGGGHFTHPHGIDVNSSGEILVSDTQKNRIHVLNQSGRKLLEFGEIGNSDGNLNYPVGVAFDKNGKNIVVADRDNHRIQIFSRKNGKFLKKFGSEGSKEGQFNGPCGISIDANGRIIVTDWNNHRIQVFSSDGRFLFKFGDQSGDKLKHPRNAIYNPTEECFIVSDTGHNVIKVYDKKGKFMRTIGRPGSKRGELFSPRGIAIDRNDRIIICDFDNHRIQFFDLKGHCLNSFGAKGAGIGQFNYPTGVAVLEDDKMEEQILVTDWGNDRIQIFNTGPQWKMARLLDLTSVG